METFKFWTPNKYQFPNGSINSVPVVGKVRISLDDANTLTVNIDGDNGLINLPTDPVYIDDVLFSGTGAQLQDALKPVFPNAAETASTTLGLTKADLVGGKVPASQLPSYVDDVVEYANEAAFPATGETGKIYVCTQHGDTYRWSGSAYTKISDPTWANKADKDVLSALAYSASVALDFNSDNIRTINLTGNLTFSPTLNKGAGKSKVVRLVCDGTARTLAFPAEWVFIGDVAPTSIAASKTGILSLYCFGTNASDVIASYSVQP